MESLKDKVLSFGRKSKTFVFTRVEGCFPEKGSLESLQADEINHFVYETTLRCNTVEAPFNEWPPLAHFSTFNRGTLMLNSILVNKI